MYVADEEECGPGKNDKHVYVGCQLSVDVNMFIKTISNLFILLGLSVLLPETFSCEALGQPCRPSASQERVARDTVPWASSVAAALPAKKNVLAIEEKSRYNV
jgi:hypothetical protein